MGGGAFVNLGDFVEDGNSRFDIDVSNDGTFSLGPAIANYDYYAPGTYPTLDFAAPVTGSGAFDLGSGGITFAAPVASGETIAFVPGASGAPAVLTLDDLDDFAASISGFDQNGAADDSLVVSGDAWSFQGYEATGPGTGELVFASASHDIQIPVIGDYLASLFHDDVTASGTTLTYTNVTGRFVAIDGRTIYSDATPPNSLFEIVPDATLILPGDDTLANETFGASGFVRNLGSLAIDDGATIVGATTFVNSGDMTLNGGALRLGPGSADAALFRNLPGATLTLAQGADIESGGALSSLINLGELQQTGADVTSTINASFYNRGTVDVAGSLDLAGSTTRLFGQVEGAGAVTGANVVLLGTALAGDGFRAIDARLFDDVVASGSYLSLTNANLLGATLTLDSAGLSFDATNVFGQGRIVNQEVADFGSGLALDDGVSLVNAGTLTTDSVVVSGAANTGGAGELTNRAGATWIGAVAFGMGGAGAFSDKGGTQAGFDNEGTFEADADFFMDVPVINNGWIELGPPYLPGHVGLTVNPNLQMGGPIAGTGQIDLNGGTIETDGAVGAGQTFNLSGGSGSVLAIDDFVDFAGRLAFAPAAAADVVNVTLATAGWIYSGFQPGAAAGTGELLFSDGPRQQAISLSGVADANALSVTAANGVTTLQYKSG